MIGVKNLDGILGAEILRSPGLVAAALNLGDKLFVGPEIIGPETLKFLSKSDVVVSYFPGPTTDCKLKSLGFGETST